MTEFWEPWQPQIGQRVRVRLSGECTARGTYRQQDGTRIPNRPLHEGTDGCIGIVAECPATGMERCDVYAGHPITVRRIATPMGLRGGHYAAIELEPLELEP